MVAGKSRTATSKSADVTVLDLPYIKAGELGLDIDAIFGRQRSASLANHQTRPRGKNKYRGVYWSERDKTWYSKIKYKGRSIFLGIYTQEKQAARAYNEAAKKIWGDDAYQNVIEV